MTMPKLTNIFVAIIALFLLLACGNGTGTRGCLTVGADCSAIDVQDGSAVIEPDDDSYDASAFSCTAVPSSSTVYNSEIFTLNISAQGGSSPYKVPGYINSFASTTALNGGYYNSTGSDRIVTRTVYVADNQGRSTSCNFSVTVRSQSATNNLACTIGVVPENPKKGQVAEFTIDVTGGASPTFDKFNLQPGWQATVSKTSAIKAKVQAVYNTPGLRTAGIRVSQGGFDAICSKQINVMEPKLEISASSSVARIDQVIKLRAIATGFDPSVAVKYVYETTESGIILANNGDNADVSVADGRFHNFSVRVKAYNDLGESSGFLPVTLKFTSDVNMACEIQNGPIAADGSIPFQVVALNSSAPNDQLVIKYFNAGPGAVKISSGNTNPVSYKFYGTGFQVVTAQAESLLTGTPCYNGASFSKVIRLREPLNRCDVVMNPNPSLAGQEVIATVTTPSNVGSGNYKIEMNIPGGQVLPGASVNTPRVRFPNAGSYPITATVTDLSDGNRQVSCNTTQTVTPNIVEKFIDCRSANYRKNTCYIGPGQVLNVFLVNQYSITPCNEGLWWSYDGNQHISVNYGCQARFQVRVRVN